MPITDDLRCTCLRYFYAYLLAGLLPSAVLLFMSLG